MASNGGTSRRSVLGAALAMTGLAGTGIVSKFGSANAAVPDDADELPELATLHLDRFAIHTTSSTKGAQRGKGDQTLLRGTLTDDAGARVGEVFASAFTMPGAIEPDTPSTPRMELQNLQLADGTIVAMGTAFAEADIANVYTIVGGSGRYVGLRGSYTFDHDPSVARPEGGATISFDLDRSSVRSTRSVS